MVKLPYFASNGAIVGRRLDAERFSVSLEFVEVTVDVGPPFVTDWGVDLPPNWLHTDAEAKQARVEAIAAVREWVVVNARQGVNVMASYK